MTLHSPRTLPGLFVHLTWGSAFSAERFCFAFVVPLRINNLQFFRMGPLPEKSPFLDGRLKCIQFCSKSNVTPTPVIPININPYGTFIFASPCGGTYHSPLLVKNGFVPTCDIVDTPQVLKHIPKSRCSMYRMAKLMLFGGLHLPPNSFVPGFGPRSKRRLPATLPPRKTLT